MKKLFLTLFLSVSLFSYAYTPGDLRFHCADDTIKINKLLQDGRESGLKNPNELISFYAQQLLGTPYVAHTLEGESEKLTINIDELDCTTFVETLLALAKTTMNERTTWREFAMSLENIRYRKGTLDGYSSRLHYMSDWVIDNNARGNITEVTSEFPRKDFMVKSINFMTKHKDSYQSLKNDPEMVRKIKNVEIGYRQHRYPVIKKNQLRHKNVKEAFNDGDIIFLVTKIDGLDVSHLGIIKFENEEPHLLHASSVAMKVIVDDQDLFNMLRKSRSNIGIRVIRLNEQ